LLVFFVVEYDEGINPLYRVGVAIWGSLFTTIGVGLQVLYVYGYLIYAGANISSIPAVSIIMATGVGVEFCAYIVLCFQRSHGTRRERVFTCLDIMFAPNIDGGITMLLGVCLLLTSLFPFVIKYFFLPWVLIVIFGWIVSLMFIPAMLSLCGPPNIHTVDTKPLKE